MKHTNQSTMFYTYVLYSPEYNKTYVGYASNLEGRLQAHNHLQNKGWTHISTMGNTLFRRICN